MEIHAASLPPLSLLREDLSAKDLVMGVARLKGAARNIDMALFRKETGLFNAKCQVAPTSTKLSTSYLSRSSLRPQRSWRRFRNACLGLSQVVCQAVY